MSGVTGKVSMDDKMKIQTLCEQGLGYQKDFRACVKARGRQIVHVSNKLFSQGFELLASCDSLKCQISMFSFDFNTSALIKIVIFIVIQLHCRMVV